MLGRLIPGAMHVRGFNSSVSSMIRITYRSLLQFKVTLAVYPCLVGFLHFDLIFQ